MRYFFLLPFYFLSLLGFSQDSDYQFDLLDSELVENANAIFRQDEMIISILSKKDLVLRRKKVITVLNELGDQYAMAYVGYDNSRKIKSISATVYDSFGNRIDKIKEKDFQDFSAVDGNTLYSDSRVKYYQYTPIQYPYTLELNYEVSTKNTGEIPATWLFLKDFMVSTEQSNLIINFASPDLEPVIKEKNLEGIEVLKNKTTHSIQYSVGKIKAFKEESLCPSFEKLAPHIKIRPVNFHYEGYDASINSWSDLGIWMSENLLSGRDELPVATISNVKALTDRVDDNLEKAKIVYKYVQENTRYISVQVGIGGIQPISAIDVDRVKYGDCKGLSNYTKALLKAVGVEAYYVHVEAGRNQVNFDQDFPDLAQGNHAILAIPYSDRYYWIDCTSQVHPFGFIGDFTDNRKVFVIKPDGGEIVTTSSYLNEQNFQLTEGLYTLFEDGSIQGELEISTKGIQYDDRFTLADQSEEKIEKHYKKHWNYINNLNVGTYQFENNRNEVRFTEQLSLSAANYASKSGDRLLFAANAFNKQQYIPARYRNRKLPFEIQRGFLDEDRFTINIPNGFGIEAMPEAININNKYGSYSLLFEEIDGKIILKRKLLVKSGTYANTDYSGFRDFMKNISKYDNSKIVIKPIL